MSKVMPAPTQAFSAPTSPQILMTSAGRAWSGLDADFVHVPRGMSHAPVSEKHRLGMHFGPPVKADCYCDGQRMQRVQKSGDIDILPAGADGSWKDDVDCHTLQLSIHPSVLLEVAEELGKDVAQAQLRPRFQLRDARIEAIGWAVKAALESATPSDTLYIGSLATALAVRLVETASDSSPQRESCDGPTLSARQLRVLTDYIESNLDQKLQLVDLAGVAGVGVTRLKTLFRNTTGLPVHQYVIRRRVEYARTLLTTTTMTPADIATAAGFSHQSHMTSTMRRLLGQTPAAIAQRASGPPTEFVKARPNLSDRPPRGSLTSANMTSSIAVVGAAGNIGYSTSLALRQAGVPVRAILRDATKADKLSALGCEIGLADLQDSAALSVEIANVHAVQVILPPPPQSDDAVAEMRRSIDSIAEALEEARPSRVVAISDYGAHVSEWVGMPSLFRLFEERLHRLDAQKVFLRSAEHMHGWAPFIPVAQAAGILPSLHHPVDALFPTVSTSDVGLIAADLLTDDSGMGERIVHVEGPRRYSASDVASALSELLGREVTAQPAPRDQWQKSLEQELSPSMAKLVADVYDAHNKGGLIDVEPDQGEIRRGTTELIDALRPLTPAIANGAN